MRLTKGLILGLVGALLLGWLVSAAFVTVSDTLDGPTVAVPNGRVGDEVTYATFSGSQAASVGESWTPHSIFSFQLVERSFTLARDGSIRDAVTVASNMTVGAVLVADMVGGPNVATGTDSYTFYDFVDVGSRNSIRLQLNRASAAGSALPHDLAFTRFLDRDPDLGLLKFQGRSLGLGQDTMEIVRSQHPFYLWAIFVGSFSFPGLLGLNPSESSSLIPLELAYEKPDASDDAVLSSRVARSGRVDGREAVAVETTLNFPGVSGKRIQYTRIDWLSSDTPYPLAIRVTVEVDDKVVGDTLTSLAVFEPGRGESIDWESPKSPPGGQVMDRSLNPGSPSDGKGEGLVYPLSQAVAEVQADLTLVQFQAWRAQNPDNVLLRARLVPGHYRVAHVASHEWELGFASSRSGEMFTVFIERSDGAPTATHDVRQLDPVPFSFDATEFAEAPITINEAIKRWRMVASPEFRSAPVNYFEWGPFGGPPGGARACLSPQATAPTITVNKVPQLQLVSLGTTTGTNCAEQQAQWSIASVILNVTTGQPYYGFEVRREFDYAGLPLPNEGPRPEDLVQTSALVTSRIPSIEAYALSTVPLILLVLAVYFWPSVKFVGAKTALILSGFTKLHRDRLLDNRIRDELVQEIQQDPGVHASELGRRVRAGWGTIVHHLSVLEKNQVVSSLLDGREKRFFPVGVVDFSKRGQLAALKHDRARAFYQLIQDEPGIMTSALSRQAGISVAAAMWHLQRLETAGLVGAVKRGRKVHYYANGGQPVQAMPEPGEAVEIV